MEIMRVFCIDIDECTSGNNTCNFTISKCKNTEGSFECNCLEGFMESATGECISKSI